jgi:acyl-CoA oxidase
MKLFPILATLVAHTISSKQIFDMYDELCLDIEKGDFKKMDLVHHLSSGGKSVFTQDCLDSLILIRQSLGGAGYSAWSGIPYLISLYSPEVTYEGDNSVMAQQSFNYLRKLIKKSKNGTINDLGFFNYLNELKELTKLKCQGADYSYFLNVDNLHTALKVNLAVKIKKM